MSFSHQGQQYWRSTETDDKKLAQRIFDKLKGEIAEGKWFDKLPGEAYTFKNLIEKYMAEYSEVNKKASSHKRDKSLAAHLLKSFGDVYLTDITPVMISDYKVKRRSEGASPRTINYELTLMGHAFNIAIKEWEWVKDNPVRRVKKDRVNNSIERWLTLDEEERLLKASPSWLNDIIIFAIHTGLRQSEILDLKWFQIDMKRRTITISEQKNGGIDTLPLNETVMDMLRIKDKATHASDDYVFPSNVGTRKGNRDLLDAFYKALERALIKNFRFHDLRHTFATRLVQNGVGIYEVQKLGRWKNTSMVLRYAHHYPESLRSSIEVLDTIKAAA
jgi:integrase